MRRHLTHSPLNFDLTGFKVQLSREATFATTPCLSVMYGVIYTRKMLTAEQAKGANDMQLCVVDCRVYIVDAESDECLLV